MSLTNKVEEVAGPLTRLAAGLQELSIVGEAGAVRAEEEALIYRAEANTAQEQELDGGDRMFYHAFDSTTYEARNRAPIFTHALLGKIRIQKQLILREKRVPDAYRRFRSLEYRGQDGKAFKIWEDDPDLQQADWVDVHYMTRVEMHPDFQKRYGKHTNQIRLLRKYNGTAEDIYLPAPYAFDAFERDWLNEHEDLELMRDYQRALAHSTELWLLSASRARLEETIIGAAAVSAPIRRIVCFGLGRLNLDSSFYDSALQHMTVFSIAKTLRDVYARAGKNSGRIHIILQDPMYEEKDRTLLCDLHHNMGGDEQGSRIRFVSDPEGLLAIDANTLIVTAHLPVQMPLLQIVADLFASGSGPAAILCDSMALDIKKRMYTLSDRESPSVAKFLTSRYLQLSGGFQDHELEPELKHDAYGDRLDRRYWLPLMDLYVRRRGERENDLS